MVKSTALTIPLARQKCKAYCEFWVKVLELLSG